ncbi:glycerol-3-phosphate dehydrogenase/oxidase [Pseudogracilibacillus sp. SE30717A]|uniref:glycerol-3-phosphate dehydrogenase/oxidase n=1 Tax=Pseudogracilibacillus sp. SE30717A TaxID=3098293 RepID=UPI00300DE589
MYFSNLNRNVITKKLETNDFDVLIIGGGITGAGIALDAATRGLKVGLFEMNDFASGTSSRSTKLVHGGLRYLKQFEFKEVAELGRERAVVYENGPHVTIPERMLLPFHQGGTFGKTMTSLGLTMYDFLAQVKKSERRVMISREEVIEKVPFIKSQGLKGGGVYVEYRTDDARLTLEVMKAAHEKGASILNYAEVTDFLYDKNKKISGLQVKDKVSNKTIDVRSQVVINASGPWVDSLRKLDYTRNNKHLKLSKGVHIVFDASKFPLEQAVYFDTHDKRMVFAIPRDGKTYVGTTDDFYDGDPGDMHVLEEEVDYLLKAIKDMFPSIQLSEKDVESSWAGVRPLIHQEGKDPSEISRKDEIWESESNLITIAGGKLTGYRKMAETIVDLLYKKYISHEKFTHPTCQTKNLPISGGNVGGSKGWSVFKEEWLNTLKTKGVSETEALNLIHLFGSNIQQVIPYLNENDSQLPDAIFGKLMYSLYYEMVLNPVDFFYRRTGELLFNIEEVRKWKDEVIQTMANKFDWSDEEKVQQTEFLEKYIHTASNFS